VISVATATELWRLSATDLAQAIRSKQISSQEVIEAHLRRIQAVNPAVNAVTVVLAEPAVEAAKAAESVVAAGGELPPLHGVPFTVKGNIDLVGTPTTQEAKALVGAYPTLDAPVVERLKAAGAIPIGRTNLPPPRFAGTPTASCMDRRSTRGTDPEPPGPPAPARPRPWPPA
jgi:amidase